MKDGQGAVGEGGLEGVGEESKQDRSSLEGNPLPFLVGSRGVVHPELLLGVQKADSLA